MPFVFVIVNTHIDLALQDFITFIISSILLFVKFILLILIKMIKLNFGIIKCVLWRSKIFYRFFFAYTGVIFEPRKDLTFVLNYGRMGTEKTTSLGHSVCGEVGMRGSDLGLTTVLTIYGFGLCGNSGGKSTRKHRFRTRKPRKAL